MIWRATAVSLLPEAFPGHLQFSLAGAALTRGDWAIDTVNPRNHAHDRHRSVDDTPFGGGPGMVLRPDVLARAIDAAAPEGDPRPRVLMTPRGTPISQARVREIAAGPGVVVVCGRFEGIDERVIAARGLEEMSVGDAVLSGGEAAALLLIDACVRLLPGVMGHDQSGTDESFEDGLLEYPHYTRPAEFEGQGVPPVLTGGDHAAIARWRALQARAVTRERRPDLFAKYVAGAMTGVDKPRGIG